MKKNRGHLNKTSKNNSNNNNNSNNKKKNSGPGEYVLRLLARETIIKVALIKRVVCENGYWMVWESLSLSLLFFCSASLHSLF